MSRVLVTGGSGFVGRHVLPRLVSSGADVHALSHRCEPLKVAGVRWHQVDLGDREAVDEKLAELAPEQLMHLAWYVEPGHFWDAPENVLWVERSLQLLRAFNACGGKRAVMVGTCAEYDWTAATAPLNELTSPIVPRTLYAVAKDGLRRIGSAYAEQAGFELAWARLFFLYGPGEAQGRLVSSVVRSLLAGEQVPTTSGRQRRDFLYVEDVAGALVTLLDSPAVGPVNIGSGEPLAVGDLVALIAQTVGRPELVRPGALPDRPGEPPLLVGDVNRLSEEVGFAPQFSRDDAVAATIEWWTTVLGGDRGGSR